MGTCPRGQRLYVEHHAYIMYLQVKICLSDLLHHLHVKAHSCHQHGSLSSIHCCLTFGDDDISSTDNSPLHGRTEQSSLVEQQMACHLTDDSFQDITSEEEVEEHFPTAPLDDDVWMEDPVPDRHLCIDKQLQPHDLCPYPCPYSLDQLHPAPEYASAPQYIDQSDIFDFPDVMTTTSDEDIPNLEDVFWTLKMDISLHKL